MTKLPRRQHPSGPNGKAGPPEQIDKAPSGIIGLDEITRGGLPRGRTTLVSGGPGSGKTLLALETLVNGARRFDEPGIFVAFEERATCIRENAASFGWEIGGLERKRQLVFIDAHLDPATVQAGDFDLSGLLAAIKAQAEEIGAKRIVFDAIDILLALLSDARLERRELLRLQHWLRETGLTAILTGKLDSDDPALAQRNSFTQFMVDAVIRLDQKVAQRIASRSVRILKYRGSAYTENETPVLIGPNGLEIASVSTDEKKFAAPRGRISTGLERLDAMLDGGYYRGASILITGAPGTAKSTLSCAFAEAACLRNERVLYVTFDESGEEIIRNSSSVGIDLGSHVESGLLRIHSRRADSTSADSQLLLLKAQIEQHEPACVVVDPVSALVKGGGTLAALIVSEGLLHITKCRGATILCTSLLDGAEPQAEASSIQISTVADTWIHVSYMIQAGERNRALTIVKSRGTRHSNQVRELVLSDGGVTLADVYTAGGEVLMGTMRWLKEEAEAGEHQRVADELEHKRREIELARAELNARQVALQRDLEIKQGELDTLLKRELTRAADLQRGREELARKRSADEPGPVRRRPMRRRELGHVSSAR